MLAAVLFVDIVSMDASKRLETKVEDELRGTDEVQEEMCSVHLFDLRSDRSDEG